MIKQLFKLQGEIPRKTSLIILLAGFIFFSGIWILITKEFENPSIEFNAIDGITPYKYSVTGPNNYKYEFTDISGDGVKIDKLTFGKYTITAIDSLNNKTVTDVDVQKNIGDAVVMKMPETKSIYIRADVSISNAFVPKTTLPSPKSVVISLGELHFEDSLVLNTFYSLRLNFYGYIEAIIFSILLGFLIGLFPFFRSLLSRYIDAIRFVALGAVTGLFIQWFGSEMNMKVQFLAFGIFVFLLPLVVQRIDQVDRIYRQTAYTLGATSWQTIRYVYWPFVKSKIIDDIRVLTAISWTYIIVAESVDKSSGGLGALIATVRRIHRYDKLFAILLVIIFIGIIQDLLFSYLDKKLNPHKFV